MIESKIEAKNFIGGEWVPADSGEVSRSNESRRPPRSSEPPRR